jgi:hypothetical protein
MNLRRKPKGFVEADGVTAREFVRVWQSASSVAEVAKKLNRTKNACRVRAFRYRQMGVPLKEFPWVETDLIDWDELAEYAESLEPGPIEPPEAIEIGKIAPSPSEAIG